MDALRQLHVIEHTPEPEAPPALMPARATFDDLTPEERRETENFIQSLRGGRVGVIVKREHDNKVIAPRKKTRKSGKSKTVDLTGDD